MAYLLATWLGVGMPINIQTTLASVFAIICTSTCVIEEDEFTPDKVFVIDEAEQAPVNESRIDLYDANVSRPPIPLECGRWVKQSIPDQDPDVHAPEMCILVESSKKNARRGCGCVIEGDERCCVHDVPLCDPCYDCCPCDSLD